MVRYTFTPLSRVFLILIFLVMPFTVLSQNDANMKPKSSFWSHVQFGGGFGLSLGNDFTNITVAPSAIYNFNQKFAAGVSVQYSYIDQENFFSSNVFGGSLIGLYNPLPEIQLSLELEEVNVNNTYVAITEQFNENFWYTGLYVGAGYRTNNVTIGFRYNLLFDRNIDLYGEAFMPFVRVFF